MGMKRSLLTALGRAGRCHGCMRRAALSFAGSIPQYATIADAGP
jgi:hypothetical protein